MDRCAAPHSAAPLRGPARSAPAASGRPWPSPFSRSLRSCIARLLPRVCACRLTPARRVFPASAQRARWSRAPSALAAPLGVRFPHPRIARRVRALLIVCRARSRGYRRPCDITRNYAAHLLCVRRGMRHPWRMKARARVIRRYVTWPPARPCACCGGSASMRCIAGVLPGSAALRPTARHPWLAAPDRVSRLRAGLAPRLRQVCRRALEEQSALRWKPSLCCSLVSSQDSAVLGASRVEMNVLTHALDAPARGAGGFPPTAINA